MKGVFFSQWFHYGFTRLLCGFSIGFKGFTPLPPLVARGLLFCSQPTSKLCTYPPCCAPPTATSPACLRTCYTGTHSYVRACARLMDSALCAFRLRCRHAFCVRLHWISAGLVLSNLVRSRFPSVHRWHKITRKHFLVAPPSPPIQS